MSRDQFPSKAVLPPEDMRPNLIRKRGTKRHERDRTDSETMAFCKDARAHIRLAWFSDPHARACLNKQTNKQTKTHQKKKKPTEIKTKQNKQTNKQKSRLGT